MKPTKQDTTKGTGGLSSVAIMMLKLVCIRDDKGSG